MVGDDAVVITNVVKKEKENPVFEDDAVVENYNYNSHEHKDDNSISNDNSDSAEDQDSSHSNLRRDHLKHLPKEKSSSYSARFKGGGSNMKAEFDSLTQDKNEMGGYKESTKNQ